MGDTIKISPTSYDGCPFRRLVEVVKLWGHQGLWGGGCSIRMHDQFVLLFDVGCHTEYDTYERVRIFKNVARAAAELVLAWGRIPHAMNISDGENDHSRLIAEVAQGELPEAGYWSADWGQLTSDWAHECPCKGEDEDCDCEGSGFQSCGQQYCGRCH